MSNPFGVPPPPPTQIFEPRQAPPAAPAAPKETYRYVEPEQDVGRRRLATFTAFVAVTLLVFGNVGAWVNSTAAKPAEAGAVAEATNASVVDGLTGPLATALTAAIESKPAGYPDVATLETAGTSEIAANPRVKADVDKAVQSALDSESLRGEWLAAVRGALDQQRAVLDGSAGENPTVTIVMTTSPFAETAKATLTAQGYTFTAPPLSTAAYSVSVNTVSKSHSLLRTLGNTWWLLLLGAVALGAASIVIATRRLRMATVLSIDAVVMLAGCLLLIPLGRQVVDDPANTPAEAAVLHGAYDVVTSSLRSQTLTLMILAGAAAVVFGLWARIARRSRARADARSRGTGA